MKKSLLILLFPVLALTACEPTNPGEQDPITPPQHIHTDANKDHVCDQCFVKFSDHVDTNGDQKCDYCNAEMSSPVVTLNSIIIMVNPNKTTYKVGESFEPSGMVVKANYSDNSQKEITDYTYSTEKFTTVGKVNFEISYEGKTATIEIDVQPQKEEIEVQEYTEEIMCSGSSFAGHFGDGYHFDTQSHKEELADFFYDQVDYENLITEVETDNLHSRKFNSETYLQFGSGSNAEGSIVWTSVEKIYKVEINVCCYAKYDSYHGFTNVDSWSHIAIDSEDFDLTYDGKTDPQMMTFSKEYSQGVTSFRIASSMGRVLMKSMKITWRG